MRPYAYVVAIAQDGTVTVLAQARNPKEAYIHLSDAVQDALHVLRVTSHLATVRKGAWVEPLPNGKRLQFNGEHTDFVIARNKTPHHPTRRKFDPPRSTR